MVQVAYIKRFINGEVKLLTDKQNKEYNKRFNNKRYNKISIKPSKKKIPNKLKFKSNIEACNNISHSEQIISDVLLKLKIPYIRECEFDNLINPKTKHHLRFDFYIPKYRLCIEYDGKQHFIIDPNKDINLEQERLESQKYRDLIKDKYCKTNTIKLIRLDAKQFYTLEKTLISIFKKLKIN